VKVLLDTHVAIWAITERKRIPKGFLEIVADASNSVFVSVVAVWETAMKHRLARPDSPPFSGHEAIEHFRTAGFGLLNVAPEHAAYVERLPPIHFDPFDRLMLAQAIVEDFHFITHDSNLRRYDAAILSWS
jgi:PIN domain nuclease of toxin-antitoxin system